MVLLLAKLAIVFIVFESSCVFGEQETTSVPNATRSKEYVGRTTFNPKYIMWRFKNFPTRERYVPMRERRLPTESTTPGTVEPKNGESDWKMLEIGEKKTNGHQKRRPNARILERWMDDGVE